MVEGGYLDIGFTLYRVWFESIQKSKKSCITRSIVEYDLKEDVAANTSMVSIQPLVMVMEAAANYLMNKNIWLRGLVECTKRKYEIEHENTHDEWVTRRVRFHVPIYVFFSCSQHFPIKQMVMWSMESMQDKRYTIDNY